MRSVNYNKLYASYSKQFDRLSNKYDMYDKLTLNEFKSVYNAARADQYSRLQAGEIQSVGSITNKVANLGVKFSYDQARALKRGLKDLDISTIGDPDLEAAVATISGMSVMQMRSPEVATEVKMTISEYNDYLKSQGMSNSFDRRKKIGQVFFGSP